MSVTWFKNAVLGRKQPTETTDTLYSESPAYAVPATALGKESEMVIEVETTTFDYDQRTEEKGAMNQTFIPKL